MQSGFENITNGLSVDIYELSVSADRLSVTCGKSLVSLIKWKDCPSKEMDCL